MFKQLLVKRLLVSFGPALLLLAFVTAGAWGEQPKVGGTLRLAVAADVTRRMDPRYLASPSLFPPGYMLYEFLFTYGAKGAQEIIPGLVENWKQLDPVTYLFYLRKGVKFHNGREMMAEDVRANLDWALKTPEGWRPVVKRAFLARTIDKVEVVDRYTLRIRLKAPYALLMAMIRMVNQGIAPPEEVKKWDKDFTLHPSGTGPFKFVEQVPGDRVILERFEGYWGKRPYLDRVIVRTIPDEQSRLIALQTGEIDVTKTDLSSLPVIRRDPNLKAVVKMNLERQGAVWFNMRNWPMNSLKFRQAIAAGAQWDRYPVATYTGVSTRTLLERSWAANPKAKELVPPYNPERAARLIKEVEAEAGRRLPQISYLMSSSVPDNVYMGELAKTELKKIGVEIKLDLVQDVLAAYPAMKWDLLLFPPSGPGADPYFLLELFTLAGEGDMRDGKNRMGYVNPKIDELLRSAITIEDQARRAKIYQEIEEMVLKDLPVIYYYTIVAGWAMTKKVQDLGVLDDTGVYVTTPWNNTWMER